MTSADDLPHSEFDDLAVESADLTEPERAMVVELRSAGIATDDYGVFTTLRLTSFDYQRAVPILLAWLPQIDSPEGKETIARSLTGQPEARRLGAARVLVDQFRLLGNHPHTKWAFANALATLADATIADDLVALLRSPEHGHSREMLCDALKRTRDPRAPDVLIQLLDDDEVAGHAIAALRSYGPKASLAHLRRAQGQLEQVVDRPTSTPFAKAQARKALKHLESLG